MRLRIAYIVVLWAVLSEAALAGAQPNGAIEGVVVDANDDPEQTECLMETFSVVAEAPRTFATNVVTGPMPLAASRGPTGGA